MHTDITSPFSQKNIQICRCGTESCRGVLGPKPKKPVEDKSIASTIIAGTKRKFQDIMGSVRAKSEDSPLSPKKRKLLAGSTALSKVKHAVDDTEVARERAEKEAAEHSRQIASRQNRALKRSTPVTSTRRAGANYLRKTLPSIKSTRITTVSFQRKVPKVGALKPVKQPAHLRGISRPTKAALGASKKARSQARPTTPTKKSRDVVSDSDEDSVNITPASLRSASRKSANASPAVRGRLSKVESIKSKPEPKRLSRGSSQRTSKVAVEESEKSHPARSRSRATGGR